MNSGRLPALASESIVRNIGEDGLTWKAGNSPRFTRRSPVVTNSLKASSAQFCAVFSFQKSSMRCQTGRSPLS